MQFFSFPVVTCSSLASPWLHVHVVSLFKHSSKEDDYVIKMRHILMSFFGITRETMVLAGQKLASFFNVLKTFFTFFQEIKFNMFKVLSRFRKFIPTNIN